MNRHFSKNTVKNVFALKKKKIHIDYILLHVVYLIIKAYSSI
jgi:Uri superfamily endonuclease